MFISQYVTLLCKIYIFIEGFAIFFGGLITHAFYEHKMQELMASADTTAIYARGTLY